MTLATQCDHMSSLQIQVIVIHSLLLVCYVIYIKPFETRLLNTMEIINESSILVAAYHLFAFTHFVEDPEMQYKVGYSIIAVTIFNVLVNMIVMIAASFKELRQAIRNLCNRMK